MHIKVVQLCFVYSGIIAVHKRHLLAERDSVLSDMLYVLWFHKTKVRPFCFCFKFPNDKVSN